MNEISGHRFIRKVLFDNNTPVWALFLVIDGKQFLYTYTADFTKAKNIFKMNAFPKERCIDLQNPCYPEFKKRCSLK